MGKFVAMPWGMKLRSLGVRIRVGFDFTHLCSLGFSTGILYIGASLEERAD